MFTKIKLEYCLRGHRRTPDNVYKSSGNCKQCNLDQVKSRWINDPVFREKKLAESRAYQKSDKWKSSMLKREYGITLEQYNDMAKEQDKKCFICEVSEDSLSRPLNVDHNHKTNKVRKLLCCNCNTAIGLLKDDPELVLKVKNYLEKYNG